MLLLCIFKQFFCAVRVDFKQDERVRFLTSNLSIRSTRVRSTLGTMSLDGSPKAKAVYGQSLKILFKHKWGILKVYCFSPFLAGPNLPLESAQNIAKS